MPRQRIRILPTDRVQVLEYNWGEDDTALHPPLDVIIVSDCLLPKLFPVEPLVDALDKLSNPQTTIIVSYEHRDYPLYDPREYFTELLVSRGLWRRRVGDEELDQDYWAEDIEVWEIGREPPGATGGGGSGSGGVTK